MGWLYSHATRQQVIESLIGPDANIATLKHCTVGNILWTVCESAKTGRKFIACYLLGRNNGQWGYKDMEESMHPYYYSCPLPYLAEAPEANADWRVKVRAYHAQRARKLAVGRTYALVGSTLPRVTIIQLKPLRGTYNGTTYRVRKQMVGAEVGPQATEGCKPV